MNSIILPAPYTEYEGYFPEKYRIVSGSCLKILAVVSMLCDHVSIHILRYLRFATEPVFGIKGLSLCTVLHGFGRIAFPIYAFLLTEGFIHTRDRRQYGIRLAVFALVSEIPWNLEHCGKLFLPSSQNVFFTLLFGYLGLCMIEKYASDRTDVSAPVCLVSLFFLSAFFGADYGCTGFAFILLLYILRRENLLQAVIGSCILSSRLTCLAFLPINLYNGKRGFIRSPFLKILFYLIYPLHIFVIFLIKRRMGRI